MATPAAHPGAAPPLLALDGVEVIYKRAVTALRGVSLIVPRGAIVALLGANGAGKTTTLRAVSGLLGHHGGRVTRGRVALDGGAHPGSAPACVRAGIAQVMEGRRIFPELTVEDNLVAGGFTAPSRAELARRMAQALTLFPLLAERRRGIAGYLSGGQQQMLAVGRALMSAPRLLLLDEPSLGLAPLVVEEIAAAILALNAEGLTVLLVEQNASLALRLAHDAVILETGAVALAGPAAKLRDDPRVRDVYLGISGGERRSFRAGAAA